MKDNLPAIRDDGDIWVETLDVFCGATVPAFCQHYMTHCTIPGADAGWHLLLCNVDCDCYETTTGGYFKGGVTDDYKKWYRAFPYGRDAMEERSGASGIVTTAIKVGDRGGCIAALMEELGGMAGFPVRVGYHGSVDYRQGNQGNASLEIWPAMIEYDFTVKECAHDNTYAKITLTADLPLMRQWPPRRMYKAFCRWPFKGCECQYTGGVSSCAKTISACRALGNIAHFGGFPGCGTGGLAQ